jgi:TusA-related sulfurtransferase
MFVATRSVPSSPDPSIPPTSPERPSLVRATGDAVGFLDAPGLDAAAVLDTIDGVLGNMPDGAILTVYTDDPATPAAASDWCAGRTVELLAIIPDEHHGTTLTFRRADPPAGDATTERPQS